jgi:translation initiation factor IF-3
LGVVSTQIALEKAQAKGKDLVEISPQATPPVCKIIDYKKFLYEMKQKDKEARKKQKNVVVKEVRVRPRIGEHDLNVKIKHAREFLEDNDKVQLTAMFAGREMQHKDLGLQILEKIKTALSDIADVEGRVSSMGTRTYMLLAPKKKQK